MNKTIQLVVFALIALLATGCKLAVMVPSGGKVLSSSTTRDCTGPGYCEFEIIEPTFSETFTAVPHPGFEFVRWQDGNGFICADATDPVCTVEMPNPVVGAAVVASFTTGLLRPVFSDPGGVDTDGDGIYNPFDPDDDNDYSLDEEDNCPLEGPDLDGYGCPAMPEDGLVLVGDKHWMQPYLFPDLSWHDINAVCPVPTGACSGTLGYLDVTGMTWASGAEVTAFLNSLLPTNLGAVPDFIQLAGWTTLEPYFFEYFRSQTGDPSTVYGWIRDEANILEGYVYGVRCAADSQPDCFELRAGAAEMGNAIPKSQAYRTVWLYQLDN